MESVGIRSLAKSITSEVTISAALSLTATPENRKA
jgi:hypothetical protein